MLCLRIQVYVDGVLRAHRSNLPQLALHHGTSSCYTLDIPCGSLRLRPARFLHSSFHMVVRDTFVRSLMMVPCPNRYPAPLWASNPWYHPAFSLISDLRHYKYALTQGEVAQVVQARIL